MSADISVNPDVRIIHGKTTTLICFPDRLVFVCSKCGHTKYVQYLAPAKDIRIFDAQDYCLCGTQISNKTLLKELYAHTGTCQTVEELRLYILSLASASA